MANVPTLRFPGFTDEWEILTLGKICDTFEYGMNVPAKEYDGENRYIRITDIDDCSHLYSLLNEVSPDGNLEDKYLVKEGDILFARTGASVGKSYIYRSSDGKLYFAGFLIRAHVRCEYNPFFVFYQTLTSKYSKWVNIMSARSGQPGINSQEYASYQLSVPPMNEQKKLADFLSLIDERIALQSKLIDRLKSLMDGIVVKHWKGVEKGKYCLSDLGEAFSVMNLSKDDLTEDGKYCIIYGELFTTYDAIIDNVVSHTDKVDRLTLSGDNDLLFPASTTVNAYSLISPSAIIKRDVVLGGDMFGIHISPEHSAEYISLIINAIYRNKLSKYAKGSTIIHLHYSDIKNVQIELPELEMQLYLVGVVKRLRAKLSIETDYLTALNNVKQSLLSAMFI